MRTLPVYLFIILPGVIGMLIFGWYALVDWQTLQLAYAHFERVAGGSHDLAAIAIAEAKQNIHRVNLFADGAWVLLCAILAAIGGHALYVGRR